MKYILLAINAILTFQFAQAQISDVDKAHHASSMDVKSVGDTLIQIEHDWVDAMVRADAAGWSRYIAGEWVLTYSDGTLVTKPMALADLKEGALRIESFRLDDMKVRVYGDTAVVTGRTTPKGRNAKGEPMTGQYRFLRVWLKQRGEWRAVAFQGTRIAQP